MLKNKKNSKEGHSTENMNIKRMLFDQTTSSN
jgi:hypothetical protein